MENLTQDELELKSFDLGEMGGGKQVIFASKSITDKEHYVFTFGDGPKNEEAPQPVDNTPNKSLGRQLFDSISKLTKKTQTNEPTPEENLTKLRCFKLSQVDEKFLVEEYVDPKLICDVARYMGAGKHNDEKSL